MYIKRDMIDQLAYDQAPIQILLGPRQCGKSTLFLFAGNSAKDQRLKEISFDDLQLRRLANEDPALFLTQFLPPLLLDEIQYVPNLFPQLKMVIDSLKKQALLDEKKEPLPLLFRLTGSNQILMDKNIKESLAGRASYYYLNTLTVHEILTALPETSIQQILFKGGWPELYVRETQSVITYLNDYIRTYVEKDVMMSAGIQKISAFHTVLSLLGARTGQEIKNTEISNNSGVSSTTVKEWIGLLERADLIYLLKPYFTNMTSRLIKTPKLYFLDTGLAVRLQGWSDSAPLLSSPQIGSLFETLVCAEIVKFIRNYRKNWELFFWRTKDGEEIDFILKTDRHSIYAFEVKLAIQGVSSSVAYPPAFKKHFSPEKPLVIVTYGGCKLQLSSLCLTLPIEQLHDYLAKIE
jgi:uncharacterized protein